MIIVEGTDLLGKTTLCNAIVQELNARWYPHIYAHYSKLPSTFDKYWHYLPWINRFTVMDRFYMSRQAYGLACKNQELLTSQEIRMLDAAVSMVGGYTVLVMGEESVIKQQYKEKTRDEMYDCTRVLNANAAFKMLWESDTFSIDSSFVVTPDTGWPSQEAATIVDDYIKRQEELDAILSRRATALRS